MDSLKTQEWPSLALVKARQHFPSYYQNYFRQLAENSQGEQLEEYYQKTVHFWLSLAPDLAQYAYATGKWTVAQMLQHVIDTERVFGYRLLQMVREDQPLLKSFDHDQYAAQASADGLSWDHLTLSLQVVRQANLLLLQSLSREDWSSTGQLAGETVALAAVAWVIPGHDLHHQQVVKERYLS
jgi:hypothetical protein